MITALSVLTNRFKYTFICVCLYVFYFLRNVVKSFYTAGMLFDVLSVFDEVSEDVSILHRLF